MGDRTNECVELDALLNRLADWDGFKPGSKVHGDRPDFRITVGNQVIGIETTRLNYEEQVRAQKLHSSEFPYSWGNLTGLKDHQPRRSNEQITKSVSKHPTDPTIRWKKSGEVMLDWKDRIAAILKRKRLTHNQQGFEVCDENWLLIYHYPPSQIDAYTCSLAQQYLNEIFRKPKNVERDFDTIFVLSGNFLFRWRKQELSTFLQTNLLTDENKLI